MLRLRLLYAPAILLAFMATAQAADFQVAPLPKVVKSEPVAPVTDVKIEDGKTTTAAVGTKCIVTIETTAKKVTWRVPAGVDYLAVNGKQIAVWALPGTYTLVAQVPAGDDVLSTEVVLTITGNVGPPPVTDKMKLAAQAAYTADTSTTKAADKVALIAMYKAIVAPDAKGATLVDAAKTAVDLRTSIHTILDGRIDGRLMPLRDVMNAEFEKTMPLVPSAVLTADHKKNAIALITNYAAILEAIK